MGEVPKSTENSGLLNQCRKNNFVHRQGFSTNAGAQSSSIYEMRMQTGYGLNLHVGRAYRCTELTLKNTAGKFNRQQNQLFPNLRNSQSRH